MGDLDLFQITIFFNSTENSEILCAERTKELHVNSR